MGLFYYHYYVDKKQFSHHKFKEKTFQKSVFETKQKTVLQEIEKKDSQDENVSKSMTAIFTRNEKKKNQTHEDYDIMYYQCSK